MCTRLCSQSSISHKNRKKLLGSEHFWKMRLAKGARDFLARARAHIKIVKNYRARSTFGRWKVHETVARARSHIKIVKNCRARSTFGRWKVHETVARARFYIKIVRNSGSDGGWAIHYKHARHLTPSCQLGTYIFQSTNQKYSLIKFYPLVIWHSSGSHGPFFKIIDMMIYL